MTEPSTTSQSFAATIGKRINGNKVLVMSSPDFYQSQLNAFKDGERVSLVLTNHKPKRSDAQHKYWWVYMTLLAKETGHTPEEIHEWAKGKFLTKSIATVYGQPVRMKGSTTTLSKSAFTELIMLVEEATGIQSPPTENYFDNKTV